MQKINLYRYKGEGGTVDTLVKLPMEYEEMYRLVADEGKVLTNGDVITTVIDIPVADLEKWSEIIAPVEEIEEIEEIEEGEAE